MTFRWLLMPLALLLLAGGAAPLAAQSTTPTQSEEDERCFAETEHCISGRIREFWEQNGGLPVFGLPITAQQTEVIEGEPLDVQWFERNRLELHPENDPPFDVLLGRVGADLLDRRGTEWQDLPVLPPLDDEQTCQQFETGHSVCGDFLETFRSNGLELDGQPGFTLAENIALFGLPLSSAVQTPLRYGEFYTVQWFERARFEYHPANEPPYDVLLGRLGDELSVLTRGVPLDGGLRLVPSLSEEEIEDPPFSLRVDVPLIEGTADEPAATYNMAVDNIVRDTTTNFAATLDEFEEYPSDADYFLTIGHDIMSVANDLISVRFTIITYAGGAHPNSFTEVVNYRLSESRVLLLEDLFLPDSNYLQVLADYAMAELREREGTYPDLEGAAPETNNYLSWNVGSDGLVITFDPYQVAPYAAGPQVVAMPYSELQDVIDPQGPLAPFLDSDTTETVIDNG